MKYSAIILSGGASRRFGVDKGLFKVFGKPLISFVVEAVKPLVDEEIIVISDQEKLEEYSKFSSLTRIVVDEDKSGAPLLGALTGFKNASGKYSLLLPCDTPLISQETISFLLQIAPNNSAVIPRWPNGNIEPLHAVFRTGDAYEASLESVEQGELRLVNMILRLRKVLYLSTLVIEQLDPNLLTFHNVNTPKDLEKVKRLLRSRATS